MKTKTVLFLLVVAVFFSLAINAFAETEDRETYYSNVVYYVGEDIPADGYIVTCTGTEDWMDVVVFASAEDFDGYQSAEKFTRGEHRNAVELYAWADFSLEQDESVYIGLREGYIILLDDGRCEFTKCDLSTSPTVYAGIYIAGEDISADKIDLKCTGEYLEATLFGSKDDYREYHKMDRYTRGEESDAIEEHAKTTDYVSSDESTYVALEDGMVLMIKEGPGEYSIAEGPVING